MTGQTPIERADWSDAGMEKSWGLYRRHVLNRAAELGILDECLIRMSDDEICGVHRAIWKGRRKMHAIRNRNYKLRLIGALDDWVRRESMPETMRLGMALCGEPRRAEDERVWAAREFIMAMADVSKMERPRPSRSDLMRMFLKGSTV